MWSPDIELLKSALAALEDSNAYLSLNCYPVRCTNDKIIEEIKDRLKALEICR